MFRSTDVGATPWAVVIAGPYTLDSTAPTPGRPPKLLRSFSDQPESDWLGLCSLVMPVTDRTSTILSAAAASRGMSSQISIPDTLVEIGTNSPRNSLGASGFRSKVSMCVGPPRRKILMIDRPVALAPALASALSKPGSESPANPAAPRLKNSRRVLPSQKVLADPNTFHMGGSSTAVTNLKPSDDHPVTGDAGSYTDQNLLINSFPGRSKDKCRIERWCLIARRVSPQKPTTDKRQSLWPAAGCHKQ